MPPVPPLPDEVDALLDSDHHAEHVYRELRLYAPLVAIGDHLLVQDGNMWSTFGVAAEHTPIGGILRFLDGNARFRIDESKSPFPTTSHVWGWLHRIL